MHRPSDRLETLRIWKMTEYLDLSEESAARFFPALKTHQEQMKQLDSLERQIHRGIIQSIDNGNIDQDYVDTRVRELEKIKQRRHTARSEFLRSLPEYLSPEQQAKFLIFERRFRRILRDALRQRHHRERD